jgi:hypothetical protein
MVVLGPCYEIDYNPLLDTILVVNMAVLGPCYEIDYNPLLDTILVQNGILWAIL